MISGQNNEKVQPAESLDESQEKAKPQTETSSIGPDGQKEKPSITAPAKSDMDSTQPINQTQSRPDLPLARTVEPLQTTPVVDPMPTVERTKHLPPTAKPAAKPAKPPDEPPKPLVEPSKPSVEAASPDPDPSLKENGQQPRSDSIDAPSMPVEKAKSSPADRSSTKSFLNPTQPAEKSQPKPAAPVVKKYNKKIIAVGGAKGGVGKSMLSANLAVGLALLGQKVVLADLDLGGADVHLYAGVKSLEKTWNDFLDKKVDSIGDIMTPTAFEGLSLIGGDSSKLGSANLHYSKKLKIMRHLKELDTEFLVVDLGGDTTLNGLDFFLLADQKVVVSGTEPASVLDSYSFIKVAFTRFLERFFSERKKLKDLVEQIKDGSLEKSENYSLDFIFQEVRSRDPKAAVQLKKEFDQFRLSIVLNMTESNKDLQIAETMQKLIKDKCFLDIGILGTIPFDKVVRKAARGFTPIMVENPKCQASRNIHQMLAAIILQREQETTRAELLQTTSRIRREAKEQIDSGKMTLDGLTLGQINSVFNKTPKLRESFQKILNIMTG